MKQKTGGELERRTARLVLQLTPAEKEILRAAAKEDRRDLAFVVRAALHKMFPGIEEWFWEVPMNGEKGMTVAQQTVAIVTAILYVSRLREGETPNALGAAESFKAAKDIVQMSMKS
jgi:hypothetical protein